MVCVAKPNTPTSLVAFTECSHSTTLDLACDERGEKRPRPSGDFFELIARKGREHEDAYLASLDQSKVTTIPGMHEHDVGEERAAALTLEAMRAGAETIYQAHLTLPGWRGIADFLEKVPGTTDLGDWGYEPVDTKLTRNDALAHHVLQLAFYADAIAAIQGSLPEHVHVELGSGLRETVRTFEVIHYARTQKARLERFVKEPTETIAYPNAHCAICAHRLTCEKQWREDDHPSFVAWIRRSHVLDLARHEPPVTTLSALASLPTETRVSGIKEHSLAEITAQAAIQLRSIETESMQWEHRVREPARGFELLPEPALGDIYLDLEGDPVWRPDRSLVFLFGWIEESDDGSWVYRTLWSHDPVEESARYRELVDFLKSRRGAFPDMRVYHYSHAEPSMLSAIAEPDPGSLEEFEELRESRLFVDLYTVVRQGLRIGSESYGLKHVEKLAGFERQADVDGGSDAVVLYEDWLQDARVNQALLDRIADYNEEDCRATLAVAEWLRAHRPTGPIETREEYQKGEDAEQRDAATVAREQLADQIRELYPDDDAARLIASLLNYYEREDRVRRRELFEMINMPSWERLDDSRILADLTPIESTEPLGARQTLYTYPPQDHKADGSARDLGSAENRYVTVVSVDERARQVVVRLGPTDDGRPVYNLAPSEFFPHESKQAVLDALGNIVLAGRDDRFACSLAIARRELPLIDGTPGDIHVEQPNGGTPAEQAAWLEEVCERALGLSGGPLAVQGPPGTGKTWLASQLIVSLMQHGHTVALTAPAHAAIGNACMQLEQTAADRNFQFVGERYASKQYHSDLAQIKQVPSSAKADDALERGVQFLAGTSWLCARPTLHEQIDYLVVDEAGQYGLADTIVAAACAKKGVILVGDPLQLPQVTQARHEENGGASVLEHILGEESLIPADRGILLTVTRRMHPDVCQFISDHVYESRLHPIAECANQTTIRGTGIHAIPTEHANCSAKSEEEARIVYQHCAELIGTEWTDKDGTRRTITERDIMVVAPYNSHVRQLLGELATDERTRGIRVGTVDKFQGGEAPIVFYSMATSSDEDLPRDKEFLFSRNRLNVALSRAQCLAYIVASPELLNTRARTVDQMKLISTVCAAWDSLDQ